MKKTVKFFITQSSSSNAYTLCKADNGEFVLQLDGKCALPIAEFDTYAEANVELHKHQTEAINLVVSSFEVS